MKKFLTLIVIVGVVVGAYYGYRHLRGKGSGTPPVGDAARAAVDLYKQGQDALSAQQIERARKIFEDVTARFPGTWGAGRSWLELGDIYLNLGEDQSALDAFRQGREAADPEQAEAVERAIAQLEAKLSRGNSGTRPDSTYVARPGDTLSGIARRLGTKVELLKLANNKFDDEIRAGQTIRVSHTYPEIHVDLKKYELTLLWKNRVLRRFQIGIGKNNSTPEGEFNVKTKLINPDWYRDGRRVPYGHPDNILGTRWLGIKGSPDHSGYGIHGTTMPETIPGPTSAGSVRMLNKDVEELFEWVPIGTKVLIK